MAPEFGFTSASWSTSAHAAERSFGAADAIHGLQSSEQSQLLDAIDRVRRENVDADMDVPQIVVCGDQSSGKSSVLEAIAQIRFPVGNQAVTKFPIEVILRHAPEASISVRLNPSHDRPQSQQDQIKRFRPTTQITDGAAFKDVVQEAKAHLEATDPGCKFWSDWLSAEVSGPSQPHLTLVDLPGLIHFSDQGGDAGDIEKIRSATCQYLKNERAIVLAVVNSVNDPANQQVLSLVEQTGNAKQRTMGILTKPDEIRRGSEKEKSVLGLARNEGIHFGLGWHVLRNIGHDETGVDQKRRDDVEQQFFSSGVWATLNRENVGIQSLRSKLSRNLLACIKKDLPKLMSEMHAKLTVCSKELSELGEGRETLSQQKEYLSKILGHLQRIVEAALDGQYRKAEHLTFFNGSKETRLRDAINSLNDGFAADLRKYGKQFLVYDEDDEKDKRFTEVPHTESPLFEQPYIANVSETQPRTIRLKRYCKVLARHMASRRGKNLRTHPSEAVPDIFRQQSVFWEPITRRHIDMCYAAASGFMSTAVIHVAGRHTGDKIMQYRMNGAFDKKSDALDEKVTELLWPFQKSHPTTYNPAFEKSISSDHEDRTYIDWIGEADSNNALYSAMEAIDQAKAYYGIAIDNLVDNVATLAVERWLLHDMPNLMSPEIVHVMSDEEIGRIATEPEDSKSRRQRVTSQLDALQSALRTCRRHAEHVTTRNVPDSSPEIGTSDDDDESQSEPDEEYDEDLDAGNSDEENGDIGTARFESSTQRPEGGQEKPPPVSSGATTNGGSIRGAQGPSSGAKPIFGSSPSIFGSTGAQAQTNNSVGTASGSVIFGSGKAAGTTTPQSQSGGLFGGAAARSPAPGASFGGSSGFGASNSGYTTGAFGSTASGGDRTTQQGGSLFGGFGSTNGGAKNTTKGSGGWLYFDICEKDEPWDPELICQSITRHPQFSDSSFEVSATGDHGLAPIRKSATNVAAGNPP